MPRRRNAQITLPQGKPLPVRTGVITRLNFDGSQVVRSGTEVMLIPADRTLHRARVGETVNLTLGANNTVIRVGRIANQAISG